MERFEIGNLDVQAETAAFLTATEPHPLWEGPAPLCLAEHYDGKVRRLRLVLTKQGCLSQGEQNQFLTHTHPLHGSGLLFGYAADGFANRIGSSSQTPVILELGACFMRSAKQAAHASRSVALSAARLAKVMSPTRQVCTSLKPCTKSTFLMHGGMSRY